MHGYCLQAGSHVALDLASFEVVRAHSAELRSILESGLIDVCVCNEVRLAWGLAVHRCAALGASSWAIW